MALTKHQALHLDALLKDAVEEGNKDAYIEALKIQKSGIWPNEVNADSPHEIHDALEKDPTTGKKWPLAPFEVKATDG